MIGRKTVCTITPMGLQKASSCFRFVWFALDIALCFFCVIYVARGVFETCFLGLIVQNLRKKRSAISICTLFSALFCFSAPSLSLSALCICLFSLVLLFFMFVGLSVWIVWACLVVFLSLWFYLCSFCSRVWLTVPSLSLCYEYSALLCFAWFFFSSYIFAFLRVLGVVCAV